MKPKLLSVKARIQSLLLGGSKKATKALAGNQKGNQVRTLFLIIKPRGHIKIGGTLQSAASCCTALFGYVSVP